MPEKDKTAQYNSDLIVDELHSLGIDYVSLNPGATTRGIHDSIVNYGDNRSPELILCCHEGVAVAVASGYFRATGRPMVVLLHDIVGLLHASKAIFDAWIDRDAVILVGGNGPSDIEKRRPWIDWIHNALIPNTQVRDFVKWDDQPSEIIATLEDLIRGYNIATTEPAGPVYLSIDAAMQEEECAAVTVPDPKMFVAPSQEEGSSESMKKISSELLGSVKPVIIVDRYGHCDEDVTNLVNLAEEVGASVLDTGALFNFPSAHPLNLTGFEESELSEADVVLALGTKDLYFHLAKRVNEFYSRESDVIVDSECKIFRIDLEGTVTNSWVSEIGRLTPTSIHVSAKPSSAVKSILDYCSKSETKKDNSKIRVRIEVLRERSKTIRGKWLNVAKEAMTRESITYPGMALATWEIVKDENWVLAFPGYSSRGINSWIRKVWEISRSYQYPGRSAGTGTGTGFAIGASLANRERINIDFQPDGDLLYSAGSLWSVANLKLPLLILMLNNRSYYNDEEHNRYISRQRKRSDASSRIGIRLENPEVDYSQLGRSYGIASSGPVKSYSDLQDAFKEGVRHLSGRRMPFLVDVLVGPRL